MKTPQSSGLGPQVRRRPQHAHRRTSRSHPPRGMTAPRARPARRCAHEWGAVHVDTMTEIDLTQEVAHDRQKPTSSPGRVRQGARHTAAATAPRPNRPPSTVVVVVGRCRRRRRCQAPPPPPPGKFTRAAVQSALTYLLTYLLRTRFAFLRPARRPCAYALVTRDRRRARRATEAACLEQGVCSSSDGLRGRVR